MEINHKNGCKIDSSIGNLEYVTHKANMAHAWATGLLTRAMIAKLDRDAVLAIREVSGREPRRVTAKRHGVKPLTIWRIQRGVSRSDVA